MLTGPVKQPGRPGRRGAARSGGETARPMMPALSPFLSPQPARLLTNTLQMARRAGGRCRSTAAGILPADGVAGAFGVVPLTGQSRLARVLPSPLSTFVRATSSAFVRVAGEHGVDEFTACRWLVIGLRLPTSRHQSSGVAQLLGESAGRAAPG